MSEGTELTLRPERGLPALLRRKRALALALSAALIAFFAWPDSIPRYPSSPHYRDGRFHNGVAAPSISLIGQLKLFRDVFFSEKPVETFPAHPVPALRLTRAALVAAPDDSVFRIGHSSLILKMHGKFWLIDPMFSERASPLSLVGPKRFQAPPIALAELPAIEAVLISHDHYDHLDQASVLALRDKARVFIAPLGVGDRLIRWGIPAGKVRQLDWWQDTEVDAIRIVSTPAQHFSGRWLGERNSTLWTSWVILDKRFRLFFSGDSGYFPGFREIGARFGPFDMAFIETGAYDKRWEYVHMLPEQSLQAFLDLRGRWLLPIHNGTFDLAMHRWSEPLERISRLAHDKGVKLATPRLGEGISFLAPTPGSAWWQNPPSPQTH